MDKPLNPDGIESECRLQCNKFPLAGSQLLTAVTAFDANSIRANGDLNKPVVKVSVSRGGSTSVIHVLLRLSTDRTTSTASRAPTKRYRVVGWQLRTVLVTDGRNDDDRSRVHRDHDMPVRAPRQVRI